MDVLGDVLKNSYLSNIGKAYREKTNMDPFIKIVRHDLK